MLMGKPSSTSKAIDDANLGAACDPQIQSSYLLVNAQADAPVWDHTWLVHAGDQHRPPTKQFLRATG